MKLFLLYRSLACIPLTCGYMQLFACSYAVRCTHLPAAANTPSYMQRLQIHVFSRKEKLCYLQDWNPPRRAILVPSRHDAFNHYAMGAHVKFTQREASVSKQVTRGQNIITDGWAGASNLHPHPKPHSIHKHT